MAATTRPRHRSRPPRARRSPAAWAGFCLLGIAAVGLAGLGATFSAAQVVARSDPAAAYRLAPYDGRIAAAYATAIARTAQDEAGRARADALARRALLRDPTTVVALSTLGLNAEVRGDGQAARRLFAQARVLSRRDLQTQLWSIENAVARGDIDDALRWYDIALRTKAGMSELLYPVLAQAVAEPQIRTSLARMIAAGAPWGESFVHHVAAKGPTPGVTVDFLTNLRQAGYVAPAAVHAGVIQALIADGQNDRAWRYYAALHPGTDRRRSRDPAFRAGAAAASRFDWQAIGDAGIDGVIEDGSFAFAAPAGIGGPMLQQTLLLPPGTYRLAGRSEDIDQAEDARPYWSLSCPGGGRELGRVAVPNSAQDAGRFAGTFEVASQCPLQMLTLVARPSDAIAGLTGRVVRAELVPAR